MWWRWGWVIWMLAAESAAAESLQRIVVRQEIVHDENAPPSRTDDFLDTTFHCAGERAYAALTVGSFATGVELGGFRRDRRGSAYGGFVRRRTQGAIEDTALELGTNQKLGRSVGIVGVRLQWPDRPEDDNLIWVPSVGAEVYYSDYSFASLRIVRDPRPDTGTTFRLANRFAWHAAYVEWAIAPRTDGVVNHAFSVRYRFFLAGYARERDFDFSRLDRRVWSFGFQYDFGS